MKYWLLILTVFSTTLWAEPALSPAQDTRVRELVRETLVNNPQILEEAIAALQAQQQKKQGQALSAFIKNNASILYHDPATPVIGAKDPKLTLVNFTDYNCPYCKVLDPELMKLLRAFPQIAVAIKHLPFKGKSSEQAAELALSVWEKNPEKFRALHENLMRYKPHHTEQSIMRSEKRAEVELSLADISPQSHETLTSNLQLARQLGINGTPTTLIGEQLLVGAVPYNTLERAVRQELARGGHG
ncbi:DsbA family protein [Dongshaea marina]|uniref:DsbA family protein n=1 Tax=Dongshaea marina TaxID=2047966 RepID=UPI000D3E52CF|nr:DsbA family protein [Dongshaea marina]